MEFVKTQNTGFSGELSSDGYNDILTWFVGLRHFVRALVDVFHEGMKVNATLLLVGSVGQSFICAAVSRVSTGGERERASQKRSMSIVFPQPTSP